MRGAVRELSLFGSGMDTDGSAGSAAVRMRSVAEATSVVLTDRDFEVLRFILEMKFASSDEIFAKFFRITRENSEARSDSWTKKRLLQLERAGFLRSTYTFSEATKYFVATFRAYYALRNFYSGEALAKPIASFDLRTFFHDKLVLKTRIRLESEEGIENWISDRMLKSGLDREYGFSSMYVPDAVFSTPFGSRVALEVELAQKARSRYRAKIKSYVGVLRGLRAEDRKISKVRYLCTREQPFDILRSETRMFGDLFSVEMVAPTQSSGGLR